jgi:TolA-binding protein
MKLLLSLLIILSLSSCGNKKNAEEILAEGNKFLEEGKITEAVESYEILINDYSDSESASDALSRLAGIYQNKQVKNISEKESLEKSSELFYKLFTDYPESHLAPMGLFMAGFVQANELKQFDKATNTYNLFIEKYPDHELAASAKEELENMGLTPEEILQKNLAKSNQ